MTDAEHRIAALNTSSGLRRPSVHGERRKAFRAPEVLGGVFCAVCGAEGIYDICDGCVALAWPQP